jgi:uncharacterized protein YfaS (alpha-2-macroglobulin family)
MDTNSKSFLRRFWLPITLIGAAILALGVYLLVDYFGPSGRPGTVIPVVVDGPGEGESPITGTGDGSGAQGIQLSEGSEQVTTPVPLPIATGEPLSESELAAILARLPGLTPESGDREDFRLPEDVVPPPRTGETISETFPPPPPEVGPVAVESGPLEVLRYSPEGEIPIAPFVNITFNQPMVPIATLEDLSEADIPIQVEPNLPGTWRWLGTKTLNFQYDSELIDRMPMATEYRVTVPAGTRSATGGVLAEAVEFTFSTPPVTLTNYAPSGSSGPQPLEPVFFAAFNQRIDPQAVLDTIVVQAGSRTIKIRLATEDEVKADPLVSRMAAHALDGRWLAFTADQKLPTDTNVSITIGPGTPSAEGPLLTESSQSFSFHTYAPLRIEDHGCSWGDDTCQPLTPLYIEFNNPIDPKYYRDDMLRIEPELAGASVSIYGDTISIRGATVGRTTYRVTVSGQIQDIFGQRLGNSESLRFKIGPADPVLIGPQQIFVTLDPSSKKPALSLYAINYSSLDLRIYAVQPADWPDFLSYLYEYQRTDTPPDPPGKLVLDRTQRLELPNDTLSEVPVDLSEYLDGGSGQFIVIAKPPRGLFQEDRYWETVQVWVQVTQIGIDAFVDQSDMVVWANALQDGVPLSGVDIQTGPGGGSHTTDADGVARFAIPAGGVSYLVASKGGDQALLPASQYYWGDGSWSRRPLSDDLRWFVYDDRGMYRPGEEVHIKGWLRRIGAGQHGDVSLVGNAVTAVNYSIIGAQGNELETGQIDVNALGGFDFAFTLPENANLGYAQIQFSASGPLSGLSGSNYYHSFQIQEFRRPEFEVNARNETSGPYFAGGYAVVAVQAKYYAGDPLPNAEVTWNVTSTPSNYQPPNWPGFTFGTWTPWWWYDEGISFGGGGGNTTVETFSGTTDAAGEHFLRMDFEGPQQLRPISVIAEGTVFDVNRQAWTGTTTLLVHPASLYVGMRSDRYFVSAGEPLEIELIVTDLDGVAVIDRPIKVQSARLEWKYQDGDWRQVEADLQECSVGSESKPVTCSFETTTGGQYRITATITDENGRSNQSQITRWVSGGQQPPSRTIEQETITLIPDKESYQPGDTARILVQSPYTPAEGMLTIARSGILSTERFQIEDGSITLEVPIEAAHIPNLQIQVDLVGQAPRTDDQGQALENVPARPAYARGQLTLNIPPLQRTLELELSPAAAELEPGGQTTLDLRLIDASGEPVSGAELAVVVVDEAILALTDYQMADPVAVFYQQRSADVDSRYSRASILLVDPLSLIENGIAGGVLSDQSKALGGGAVEEGLAMPTMAMAPEAERAADAMGGGAAQQPISIRSDFNPLATFAPEVRTDATGRASIQVRVPDNLTRYRVMVVAVDGSGRQFGSAETNITARLPLMVRPSAPRFLNFGDSFELPVVLQNQTDLPLSVEVALDVTNLKLTGPHGMRVEVPAHDRVEVRFPAATDRAGTARFQVAAVAGSFTDAAQGELPVYTPATTEAFATYGVIDSGAISQPVQAPLDVFPQYGGLEITTSSTALQSLTDAVLYLVAYPFECSEQLASRILGVAALRDVLTAFEADGLPAPEEIEAAVRRDIERLSGLQNYDGGFPYWRRGQDSIPFNTIHVAHALQRAELKGFEVPETMQQNVLAYLRDIESHYPYWYSEYTRRFLSSYALYVRNLMGDRDTAKARSLFNEVEIDKHSLDGIGWLWQVMLDDPASTSEVETIRRFISNRVVETAGAANFISDFNEQDYLMLRSNRRTDGILLDTLILDNPNSDLIPKLVTGLLAHRTKGHWGNTQENVFVLLALDRYFNTFEAQTPDFVARIWLGDTYAGSQEFEGRTTERHQTDIPMPYLVFESLGGGGTQDLILSKEGAGRLYYRLGLRYAPTDLWLDPIDMGFVVQREYEAVDNPDDVSRDEDGVWHVKAGARVRVRLTMVADSRRYHVALVDPLPAGLEIVNPALAVTGSVPQDPNSSEYRYGWWWWGTWYEHQNLRDERAEAFTSLLWDGVYNYTYITRATTPGTFVVPPAKAEEMYSPEVFGRSASDWVSVE